MTPANHLLMLFLTSLLFACTDSSPDGKTPEIQEVSPIVENKPSLEEEIQRTIQLGHGIELQLGRLEVYTNFQTYTLLILTRNGHRLFADSSNTEYRFDNPLYPIVQKLDDETIEVLVELDNRPNRNLLKLFIVKDEKIVRVEELPTFIKGPSNLDSDSLLEYAGFWDYHELHDFITYDPLIYYELRSTGITLDSALTIAKNKDIYGDFHGFSYSEIKRTETNEYDKWDEEYERIKQSK